MLRDKFLIILYRGKDFLPDGVAKLIAERETELKRCQLHEEGARLKAIDAVCVEYVATVNTSTSGTLSESQNARTEFRNPKTENTEVEIKLEAEKQRFEKELRNQEHKLCIVRVNCGFNFPVILFDYTVVCERSIVNWQLNIKIEKSMKELSKLNGAWAPAEREADREMITEEERECFQKIGQKMDSCLVLGKAWLS